MSVTIDQLFYSVYRNAGLVVREGTGLSAPETEECRGVFNEFIDSMRISGVKCWRISRQLFDLVSLQGSYAIGPSGDWEVDRAPVTIERASLLVLGTTPHPEYPLEGPLTVQQFQEWRLKDLSTVWPSAYYYERPKFDGTLGQLNGTVHLFFVPSEANQAVLYIEESLSPLSATGDAVLEFPEGYQEYLSTNMAKTIAARNPRAVISPLTLEAARRTARNLKIANFRSLHMESDYPIVEQVQHDGWGNRRY